jgi:cyclopropane fatty-acyl-phospholipid synthase-like methyltransferase
MAKTMEKPVKVRKPRTDDRLPLNIMAAIHGTPAILVAYRFKLYSLLADKPSSLDEICKAKGLKRRPAEAILAVTTSLGITRLRGDKYSLTPAGIDYFLETSPTYSGALFDLTIDNYSVYSVESLKRAVMTDAPQIYGGGAEMFKSHEEQHELARKFTRSIHSASMAPATAWPEKVGLSKHRVMLDVGGGSGAHSIGAVHRWPKLNAVVFDTAPVCEVASAIVANYKMQARVATHIGDMWTDPFPAADLHFYSMIFHDWPAEKCRLLARKSFDALEPGGRIIFHEMLFNKNRSGPFTVAANNIVMLLWTEGEQYSGGEISSILGEAGFKKIEVKPTFGYWSVVTGLKP